MSVIGPVFCPDKLYLTRGRDFKWAYELVDKDNNPVDFPPGELYFEFDTVPQEKWTFSIDGHTAVIKVEHEVADEVPDRTKWQLVFLPENEPAGGDPIAIGTVKVQR